MKSFSKFIKHYGITVGFGAGLAGLIMGATALGIVVSTKNTFDNKMDDYISHYVIDHAQDLKGPRGEVGFKGETGMTGIAGPQGSIGLTGSQGATGLRGSSGATYSPPYDALCGSYTGRIYQCGSFSTIGTLSSDTLCASYSKAVTKCGGYYTIGTLN